VTILCIVSLSRKFVFHLLALNQSFVHNTFVFGPMVVAIGLLDQPSCALLTGTPCADSSLGVSR